MAPALVAGAWGVGSALLFSLDVLRHVRVVRRYADGFADGLAADGDGRPGDGDGGGDQGGDDGDGGDWGGD